MTLVVINNNSKNSRIKTIIFGCTPADLDKPEKKLRRAVGVMSTLYKALRFAIDFVDPVTNWVSFNKTNEI
jgi:hypothetical protein